MVFGRSIVPVNRIKLDECILSLSKLFDRAAGTVGSGIAAGLATRCIRCRKGHGAVFVTICIAAAEFQRRAVSSALAVSTVAVGQIIGPAASVYTVIARKHLSSLTGALTVFHLAVVQTDGIQGDFIRICR